MLGIHGTFTSMSIFIVLLAQTIQYFEPTFPPPTHTHSNACKDTPPTHTTTHASTYLVVQQAQLGMDGAAA